MKDKTDTWLLALIVLSYHSDERPQGRREQWTRTAPGAEQATARRPPTSRRTVERRRGSLRWLRTGDQCQGMTAGDGRRHRRDRPAVDDDRRSRRRPWGHVCGLGSLEDSCYRRNCRLTMGEDRLRNCSIGSYESSHPASSNKVEPPLLGHGGSGPPVWLGVASRPVVRYGHRYGCRHRPSNPPGPSNEASL